MALLDLRFISDLQGDVANAVVAMCAFLRTTLQRHTANAALQGTHEMDAELIDLELREIIPHESKIKGFVTHGRRPFAFIHVCAAHDS